MSQILNADVIAIGTVWRYRDRGSVPGMPDSPASIGFAVYLVEAESGRQLWRGLFDGSQQTVFGDLFQAKKHFKMGFKWLSADELAKHGVREVFNQFPNNVQPGNFSGAKP